MPNPKAEWAIICNHAFFDSAMKLCVIGLLRDLEVEKLPSGLRQFTLVIALGKQPTTASQKVKLSLEITNPSGASSSPNDQNAVNISVINDYLFVTLNRMP